MGGIQEGRLGPVVDRFYEAAVRPELWREVLHEVSIAFGAEGALLHPAPGGQVPPVWSEGLDEVVHAGITGGWFERNPRTERAFRAMRGPQDSTTERMLFSDYELDHLPFNAELIDRHNMRWFVGAFFAFAGTQSMGISLERRKDQPVFSQRECGQFRRLLPHLQRAGRIVVESASARLAGRLDDLDAWGCGGIVLDSSGRVLRLNRRAELHIGRGISLANSRLAAMHQPSNSALQQLIASAAGPGPAHDDPPVGPVALPRADRARPLLAHIAPLVASAHDVFHGGRSILVLIDPDEQRTPGELLLRRAFGLTGAEAELAIAIALGEEISEIAAARGTSVGTVRVQLKSIFDKTDTHRQAELVALLGRLWLPGAEGAGGHVPTLGRRTD